MKKANGCAKHNWPDDFSRVIPVLGLPLLASLVQPGLLLGARKRIATKLRHPHFWIRKKVTVDRKGISPWCALVDLGALITEVPANRYLEAVIVCLAIERR